MTRRDTVLAAYVVLVSALLVLLFVCVCLAVPDRPPRAYLLLGRCDTGCHAALWVHNGTRHEALYVFDGREPTLREYARAQLVATWWLDAWRAVKP